ncbi:hypothetical protein F4775DRAFT_555364 [Biscogniauxia sp. FL1348]|nr:hypothetical protein F4775DRAFT_555364 [Biscogniauxia sp. FL1348]
MSDESDREDHEDHTASSEPDDLDGDEYSSDQSGSEATNPLLDTEAVESDGESDDETADEFGEPESEPYFFPQFCRLPIELRERIWEYFDPNLTSKARVLDVTVLSSPLELWAGPTLDQQTEPARVMLATHRESRALALKHYPDTLHLHREKSIVHLNCAQDIVSLSGQFDAAILRTLLSTSLSDCGVKSITLDWESEVPIEPMFKVPYLSLENDFGVRIYLCVNAIAYSSRDLQPFVSDSAQKYYMQTREEEEGLGEDFECIYCWNADPMGGDYTGLEPEPEDMIKFIFKEGIRRFDKIKNTMSIEGPWEDNWQSDSEMSGSDVESEVDEYELDGFVVNSESGESEGSDNDDEDREEEEEEDDIEGGTRLDDNVSSFNGFSPLQDEDGDMGNDHDLPAAHFSSLEPESPHPDDLEDQEISESEEQPTRNTRTSDRRIISSDDAPESVGDAQRSQSIKGKDVLEFGGRPGRGSRIKRRIVSSDDEDQDEDGPEDEHEDSPVKKARPHKRARVIMSDSEDEDEEEGDGRHERSRKLDDEDDENTQGSSDSATEEEEEEEEEDSDEEPMKAKPVSLLDRLRRFKSDNPISPSGSDDESVASAGTDGTGGNGEDEGEDESGTDRGEVGMYADMDTEQDYDEEEDEGEW